MKIHQNIIYPVILISSLFVLGCNKADSVGQADTNTTDSSGTASQPQPTSDSGDSSSGSPTTPTSQSDNTTYKPKAYVVGVDACGGAKCGTPVYEAPPKELWCVTGYRACPKK